MIQHSIPFMTATLAYDKDELYMNSVVLVLNLIDKNLDNIQLIMKDPILQDIVNSMD